IGPELAPRDADRAQRVLIGVHPRHVALAHLAFRKAGAHCEVAPTREISPPPASLPRVDEVEERGSLGAPIARGETRAGGAERGRRPGAGAVVGPPEGAPEPPPVRGGGGG